MDKFLQSLAVFLLSLSIPAAVLSFWGFFVYLDPLLLLAAIGCTATCYVATRDLARRER